MSRSGTIFGGSAIVGGVSAQATTGGDPAGSPGGRRGRPPKESNREAILDATREVIARAGYSGLTLEEVARVAGLYRRYINRTWDSKAHLVRDALFADVIRFDAPDTGSLSGDLRAVLTQHVDLNIRPEVLRGLPGLTEEFPTRPELLSDTLETYARPPVDAMAIVFERAQERGELEEAPDSAVVVNLISGAIQRLALLGILDRDDLVDHAEAMVLGGLVSRSA